MKKHIKIYLECFGYGPEDFMECEVSGGKANQVHHIDARGMGGSNEKDYIENLIGLTFEEHEKAENEEYTPEQLTEIHLKFIRKNGIKNKVLKYAKDPGRIYSYVSK